MPLFWLAMFDPSDIHDATLDGPSFVTPPTATEAFEDTTYAYCAGARALARLQERLPNLGAATNAVLATTFARFARTWEKHALVLRLTALADSPIDFVDRFRASLVTVADPTTTPDGLRKLGSLEPGWEERPYAENVLIGWGTELTVREREYMKARRAASKADRAERERVDSWRAAVAAIPPERRKPYRANSAFAVGDVIDHVKFGPGVVIRIVEKTKLEVQFEAGVHVLVHKP